MNSKHTGHTGQLLPSDPPLQHQLVPSSPPNIHLAWTFHRPCHQQVLSVRRKKGENGAKILMWSKWYLVGCHDARKGVSQRPVWLSCLTWSPNKVIFVKQEYHLFMCHPTLRNIPNLGDWLQIGRCFLCVVKPQLVVAGHCDHLSTRCRELARGEGPKIEREQ